MKRILAASIWAHDSVPQSEYKYRNLKRVMFPAIDILVILAGFSAARFGIPAISEFFPDAFVDVFSYVLAAVGVACFIGIAFPHLWLLEILAKSSLLGLMTSYVVSLFMLTAVGEGNRGFVLLIAAIAMCAPIWRVTLLGGEWQERRLTEKAQEH